MSSDVTGLVSWLRGWFDDIYQSNLVSGTNIKTINNTSVLGNGNIAIGGGSFDWDEIPQGEDLDNYTWEGAFYTNAYSTIYNVPVIQPFILTVDADDDGNAIQTFVDLVNEVTYTRICFNNVFSNWQTVQPHTHTLSDITDYQLDSSWAEISYASGYKKYNDATGVFYRRRGNTIELSGFWTTSANRNASDDTIKFGSIPSSYAPSRQVRGRMQGSGMNTYLLTVETNGDLKWSRYGTTTSSQLPKDFWGVVQCTWTK